MERLLITSLEACLNHTLDQCADQSSYFDRKHFSTFIDDHIIGVSVSTLLSLLLIYWTIVPINVLRVG